MTDLRDLARRILELHWNDDDTAAKYPLMYEYAAELAEMVLHDAGLPPVVTSREARALRPVPDAGIPSGTGRGGLYPC